MSSNELTLENRGGKSAKEVLEGANEGADQLFLLFFLRELIRKHFRFYGMGAV